MCPRRLRLCLCYLLGMLASPAFLSSFAAIPAAEPEWPRFRGPNGSGISRSKKALPSQIGPDENLVWKRRLPPGHSSPAVDGDRLYITAADEDGRKLLTLAISTESGEVLWQREAPIVELEAVHQIGSRAQPSPATDGERVVSFFGSSGLIAYDRDGDRLWYERMGPFKNTFGAGASPIIAGDRVLLLQDHDQDSFLAAFDKRTGKELWKTDRSEFPRGFTTPAIWEADGKRHIVAAGTLRAAGYDFETGKEVWTVRGLGRIANVSPVIGGDGNLFVAVWSPGGDETERIEAEPFEKLLSEHDGNKNGTLESDEIPEGPLKSRFPQIDRDKGGVVTREEYEYMRRIFDAAQNVALAVRPGGEGDITETHVLWRFKRYLPYVPTPVWYDGHLYMVKNDAIFTSLEAASGNAVKAARLSGTGNYYSSPVAGDGKLYIVSERGRVSVVAARPEWEEISSADLGERTYATPAIAGGRIYIRTLEHLYAFGAR